MTAGEALYRDWTGYVAVALDDGELCDQLAREPRAWDFLHPAERRAWDRLAADVARRAHGSQTEATPEGFRCRPALVPMRKPSCAACADTVCDPRNPACLHANAAAERTSDGEPKFRPEAPGGGAPTA
jgi:hypothetical protein